VRGVPTGVARNSDAEDIGVAAALVEMSSGIFFVSTSVKPASRNMRLAVCSPQTVPSPAPSRASDTVMQWNVETG
jgi:hypothetical protein